ncbi:MAG: M56 family metallopeptidase [Mucilaginibacter sp.]|uniref:M56 family metallopeptidase n=1 Tax=Mucilaginibacter sp. TaxID=1882438 RepID=UPI003266E302
MMNWWHYLLLVNLYLVLFFTFYRVFLHKETFFQLNRAYLVAGSILSFVIPLMQSDWIKNLFITQRVHQTIYATVNPQFIYEVKPVESNPITLGEIVAWIYLIGTTLLLCRLIYQLFLLKRLVDRADAPVAFSFFKKIRVDDNLPSQQTIIEHERVHTRQWHSADVLLIEAVMIINWFNPVVYFYRKAIKHVHEYIADRQAIETGASKTEYALLLLSQTFGTAPHQLTNNFFNNSLLKKRIMMLHQNDSNRRALLKYGLSAPLFAAMLVLSSATVNNSSIVQIINKKTEQAFSVNTEQFKESLNDSISGINAFDGNVTDTQDKIVVAPKSNVHNFKEEPEAEPALQVHQDSMVRVEKSPLFTAVELNPTFPGGEESFGRFLVQNIRYPDKAKENQTQGRVFIQFTVEKDGSLSNLKNLRDPGDGLGEEAMRVLSLSPKWHPGIQNGSVVRVQYTMPVNFSLAEAERRRTTDTARLMITGGAVAKRINSVFFYRHLAGDSVRIPVSASMVGVSNRAITTIRLDGKLISEEELRHINPKNIESIQVIKRDTLNKTSGGSFKDNMILIRAKSVKAAAKG